MLRALFHSASIRAAGALALGGVAFSLGSLVLARVLSTHAYGLVSLVLGIVAAAGLAAPLGLDQVVGRRGIPLDAVWRRASLGACLAMGFLTAIVAGLIYHLAGALCVCIGVSTLAIGLAQSGASHFQGQQRFGTAVWMLQLSNCTLALVALVTAAAGLTTETEVCALLAAAGAMTAAGVWWVVRRRQGSLRPASGPGRLWGEALSLMTIQGSNSVFLQLERLLLVPTVGVNDLATYGVLAALAASPFRMLQAAVRLTLVPRLRQARDARARRSLLGHEAGLVLGTLGGASAAIWVLAPPLAHWLLAGRCDLSEALVTAAVVSGLLKVCSGFTTAVVVSCAEERRIRLLSLISWGTIGASVGGAFLAAPWGLVGVLYGLSAGWAIRCLLTAWLALAYLRQPSDGTVPLAGGFG